MTQTIPPVKRDRIGVLASTIINELSRDRIESIRADKGLPPDPPFTPTAAQRKLLGQWLKHWMAMRELERRAVASGAVINMYSRTLGPRQVNREPEKVRRKARVEARIAKVRQLRTETLIDLVTLDAAQVKAAVRAFKAAVEKV